MAHVSSSNPNILPGIVTDQPEIYESKPTVSENIGINDLDLIQEPSNEAIALIEVPIRQAFSFFAERENEIAKFYVQKSGEYKISGDRPENETDLEKYHRLNSEVHELLNKFQSDQASKSQLSMIGSLDGHALTNNLDVLSKHLKALEIAANDGTLEPTQSNFHDIRAKLEKLGTKVLAGPYDEQANGELATKSDDLSKSIRICALERRINTLESLVGSDQEKTQSLLKTTKCESLVDASETLSSWLSLFKPDGMQKITRELDYLIQKLEKINDQASLTDENKLDAQTRTRLEHLCNLVTSTDKHRAMVPTIIHRLNAMEELQQKAAQVATTVNHLEQIQSQIVDSLESNKDELGSLKEMFASNMDLLKDFSKNIDSRIASIRENNQ